MIVSRQDVQRRSYMIWEREGRPQGRDWDHWFRAEAELAREQATITKSAQLVSPAARASKSEKSKSVRKPAAKKG